MFSVVVSSTFTYVQVREQEKQLGRKLHESAEEEGSERRGRKTRRMGLLTDHGSSINFCNVEL